MDESILEERNVKSQQDFVMLALLGCLGQDEDPSVVLFTYYMVLYASLSDVQWFTAHLEHRCKKITQLKTNHYAIVLHNPWYGLL